MGVLDIDKQGVHEMTKFDTHVHAIYKSGMIDTSQLQHTMHTCIWHISHMQKEYHSLTTFASSFVMCSCISVLCEQKDELAVVLNEYTP